MIELDPPEAASRHPWLMALQADPVREVTKLLAGQAATQPFDHGEPGDAAELLFGGLGPLDAAVQALDEGLAKWLEEQRKRRSRDPRDHQVHVLRGIRALDTITRVPVKACVDLLWKDYIKWYSWADQQVPGTNADLRAAFLRTLALTQERLDNRPAEANIPFWLAISGRAGRSYPDHYVDLAILGLRRLPLPPIPERDLSKEGLCMVALANWASERSHLGDAFAWRWNALRHAFPRFPSHWETIFKNKILPREEDLAPDLYQYWAKSVGIEDSVTADNRARARSRARHDDEGKQEVLSFVRRISDLNGREAIATARRLVDERERWAQERGLVEPLAKTTCNVGQRLLRVGRAPLKQRAETALDFAMTTLRWKPQDPHGWSLWRDGLVALGRGGEAELVAWESINRFPEVEVLAINLCQIWLGNGQPQLARALLEETLAKTGSVVALTILAGLMLRTREPDQLQRAEDLLQEGRYRRNVVSMRMLAGLLMRKGRRYWDEALDVLEEAIGLDEEVPRSKVLMAGLLLKRNAREDMETVERLLREAAPQDDVAVCMLAQILLSRGRENDLDEAKRRLRAIAHRSPAALAMLRRVLSESSDSSDAIELERMPTPTSAERDLEEAWDSADPDAEEDVIWVEPVRLDADVHDTPEPVEQAAPSAREEAGSRQLRVLINYAFAQVVTDSIEAGATESNAPAIAPGVQREATGPQKRRENVSQSADERDSRALLRTISPTAVASQSAFLLRHGLAAEKADALRMLGQLADEEDLPFARFLLLGLQPGRNPRAEDVASGSFGLALYSVLRAKAPEGIAQVRDRFPQEGLLCSLAEAYLRKRGSNAGRAMAAPYLRRARVEGVLIGPASWSYMELTEKTRSPLLFVKDNDPRLIAALGKTFESVALAAYL